METRTFEQILKHEGVMNDDDILNVDYERCARIFASQSRPDEQRILKAIDDEPELPGAMPADITVLFKQGNDESIAEMCRVIVRATKKGIRERILGELSGEKAEEKKTCQTCKHNADGDRCINEYFEATRDCDSNYSGYEPKPQKA